MPLGRNVTKNIRELEKNNQKKDTETLAADGWVDLFQERNGAYISTDLKYILRK